MFPNKVTIIFDIGGVLIEWDPRHLYRKLFSGDETAMKYFLTEICSLEWNAQMDLGRPFGKAVAELIEEHPDQAELITAYQTRWGEMISGEYKSTVEVLAELRDAGYPLYALSNWSAETFPLMRRQFPFLNWFEAIVLSGEEKLVKPDPRIFQVMLARTGRPAGENLLIDDTPENVEVARQLGFQAVHFQSAGQLRGELGDLDILGGKGNWM